VGSASRFICRTLFRPNGYDSLDNGGEKCSHSKGHYQALHRLTALLEALDQ